MKTKTSVGSILSAPVAKQITAYFTLPGVENKEESVVLNDVGVDLRLLMILNDGSLSPRIVVTFLPDAPALKDYELPVAIRSDYNQHDLLLAVRVIVKVNNKVSIDKDTTRGPDGVLTQRITLSNTLVEYVIGHGASRGRVSVSSSKASISLPSGNLSLS